MFFLANHDPEVVLRIIDANLNRLREALRVVEEYIRFIKTDKDVAIACKELRHRLEEVETFVPLSRLLAHRDTETDPFAGKNRPEELQRDGMDSVVVANFKRAQEAARVLEEYAKISEAPQLSEKAKFIRFALYSLEKQILSK